MKKFLRKQRMTVVLCLLLLLLTACNNKTAVSSADADTKAADVITEAETQAETDTAAETKSEGAAESKTEGTTEKASESRTEAVTEKATEDKTEAVTEKATEGKTEAVTEKATESKTEAATEKATEGKTEAVTQAAQSSNTAGWQECTFVASPYCDGVDKVKMYVSDPLYFDSYKVRFENLPTQEKLYLFIEIDATTTDGYEYNYGCDGGEPIYFSIYNMNTKSFEKFSSNKEDGYGSYIDESLGTAEAIVAGKEYNIADNFVKCFTTDKYDFSAHDIDFSTASITIGFTVGKEPAAMEGIGQWYEWYFN